MDALNARMVNLFANQHNVAKMASATYLAQISQFLAIQICMAA